MNRISEAGGGASPDAAATKRDALHDGNDSPTSGPEATASQGTIEMVRLPATEYQALIDSLIRCRDKLLELAKACPACDGVGLVTVMTRRRGVPVERQVDCEDCIDIRDCLR